MKFIFLLGGATGFALAAGTDFLAGRNPDRILFDGAVGCLAGAIVLRWFWNVLLRGIRETYLARQRAATAPAAPAGGGQPAAPAAKAAPSAPPVAPPSRTGTPLAPPAPRSGPAAAIATAAVLKTRP